MHVFFTQIYVEKTYIMIVYAQKKKDLLDFLKILKYNTVVLLCDERGIL